MFGNYKNINGYLAARGGIGLVRLLLAPFHSHINSTTIALALLLAVLIVADALLAFACENEITHVAFGQSARSRWQILGRLDYQSLFKRSARRRRFKSFRLKKIIRIVGNLPMLGKKCLITVCFVSQAIHRQEGV